MMSALQRAMKIVFLSDDFPPASYGGAGIITAELARGLLAAGHDIDIISTTQTDSSPRFQEISGLNIHYVYAPYPPQLEGYLSLYNPRAIANVRHILHKVKPDIIHAHNIHRILSFHTLKVSRAFTSKVFFTAHDAMTFNVGKLVDFFDPQLRDIHFTPKYKTTARSQFYLARKRLNPFRNRIIRHYLSFARCIFAISHELEKALHANGIHHTKTVHYGINLKEWNTSTDEVRKFIQEKKLIGKHIIFFGGRLSHYKGGDALLNAFRLVHQKNSSAHLLIAGIKEGYAIHLMERAKKMGIAEALTLTGWLDRHAMKIAFAASDVVAIPSIYFDPFNLFNIEAMASGKPVVGTCFGGTPEITIHGETGFIVNPLNTEEFAHRLEELLGNKELRRTFGEHGRKRALEFFTIDRYVQETLRLYDA